MYETDPVVSMNIRDTIEEATFHETYDDTFDAIPSTDRHIIINADYFAIIADSRHVTRTAVEDAFEEYCYD